MDRRSLLAMVLCFLIFVSWQKFYLEKQAPPNAQTQAQTQGQAPQGDGTAPSVSSGATGTATTPATQAKRPSETKALNTGTGIAQVGDDGKFFTDWSLKAYRLGIAPEAAAVDMKSVAHEQGEGELSFDLPKYAYLASVQGTFSNTPAGLSWVYEDDNVRLTREMSSNDSQPYVDLKLTATFKKESPKFAFVSVSGKGADKGDETPDQNLVYWTKGSIERVALKDSITLKEVVTPVKWIGTSSRYFLMAFVNPPGSETKALLQPLGASEGRVSLVYPVAGNALSIPLKVYFGPKELNVLRAVDPSLDTAIDFGWFTIFAYPLLKVMKWLYEIVHNYGVAIILLTILIKILTFPLTYKSMKSMKDMARLQPQLARIREKHKDDKEALNREMLTIMRAGGYNPVAGCLPMLIQMPVFFALYRVLYSSIELYHAPFAFWIQDLAAKDPFYVTPIALTFTMWIQQKITPNTATDPAQAKMMQLMPVIFGIFMISLPAGLTIYMLVNAVVSILQQYIMNKKLGLGNAEAVATR